QKQTSGQNNITFIEKISKAQVQTVLSYFDVCFIGRNNTPLFDFGVSSNKYFDYMLSKTPILVSSNLINDPVERSQCGITVKPESAQTIADGILTFYNLPLAERKKMGEKAYDYVKKYHNFTVLSETYSSLFKNE
ncbi:MAG: glycosyltransferase family 4 protein, partial [Zetaproteobacteria bacterium]|nr:glycosyltransferase family 4 protein [Zetaproteobacteria bacterium]